MKEINPTFPVIILTGHALNFSPQDILAAEVEAFLQKPVVTDDLIRVIENIQ